MNNSSPFLEKRKYIARGKLKNVRGEIIDVMN